MLTLIQFVKWNVQTYNSIPNRARSRWRALMCRLEWQRGCRPCRSVPVADHMRCLLSRVSATAATVRNVVQYRRARPASSFKGMEKSKINVWMIYCRYSRADTIINFQHFTMIENWRAHGSDKSIETLLSSVHISSLFNSSNHKVNQIS